MPNSFDADFERNMIKRVATSGEIVMNTYQQKHFEDLANNLVETLGIERAIHVANQYGWYDVANKIVQPSKEEKNKQYIHPAQEAEVK